MDSAVEFNENGKAQVSREVGEQLAEEIESITVSGSEADGETESSDTDDTTETQESDN